MIQKRFQRFTKNGLEWSPWFNYCEDDSQLQELRKENCWQLKSKLKNEYRIV